MSKWPRSDHPFTIFIREALDEISKNISSDMLYMDDITFPGNYIIYSEEFSPYTCLDFTPFAIIPATDFDSFMNSLIKKYQYYNYSSSTQLSIIDEIYNKILSYIR